MSNFSDVSDFFNTEDFGSSASWLSAQPGASSVTATVILDAPGTLSLDGVVTNDWAIRYAVSAWSSVRPGDRVTIASVIYEVREVVPLDDGAIAQAALRRLN